MHGGRGGGGSQGPIERDGGGIQVGGEDFVRLRDTWLLAAELMITAFLDVLLPRVRWRTAQPPQPLLARQPSCGIFARGELATLDAADTMWHGGGGDLGSSTGAKATAATLTKKIR